MRKIVSIVGDSVIEHNGLKFQLAYELGKALIDNGYRVQSGGMDGVMKAVMMGAKASDKYVEGDTVAIVPSFDINIVNEYADVAIPTGLDLYRNLIVANASAVIAIGGGAGTLSEIASAWTLKRLIIAFDNVEGWSSKVAETKIDKRIRYSEIENDRVYGVNNVCDAITILNENIDKYSTRHKAITYGD